MAFIVEYKLKGQAETFFLMRGSEVGCKAGANSLWSNPSVSEVSIFEEVKQLIARKAK